MKAIHKTNQILILATILTISVFSIPAESQAVKVSFLYNLSDFNGIIPYSVPRVVVDRERNEIYALCQNVIRVFNQNGMEIYRFGDDLDLGHILDIAIEQDGDIFLLSYILDNGKPVKSILRCDYRGEVISKIEFRSLPTELSDFFPDRMIYKNGHLYFVSSMGMRILVTNSDGNFKKSYDLISLLELQEKDRGNVEVTGFSVDGQGNILFTVAVLFKAYILSADGQLAFFGKPGGAPGRFNVVAGIATDGKGNYLVADKLKSAVMVFDKKFNFLTQFGYRGLKPGNLIVPNDIAVDYDDRIYITQAAQRGVSVFRLTYH
jgi:hypothetical protein